MDHIAVKSTRRRCNVGKVPYGGTKVEHCCLQRLEGSDRPRADPESADLISFRATSDTTALSFCSVAFIPSSSATAAFVVSGH